MPIKVLSPRRPICAKNAHMQKKPRRRDEENIQQATIHALRTRGYRVQQTTHRVKLASCPKCHQKFRPGGNYGATKGIADLLIRRDNWPKYFWMQLEMKGPKTPLSPDQKELLSAEAIAIARDVKTAIEIVEEVERENFSE